MLKLLILAANPTDTSRLRLDEEVRDIRECIERARHRDDFEILQRWAVRPRDLQRAILDETPQIVHFSGHGGSEAGLYFEDEQGRSRLVTEAALGHLFKLLAQKINIHCVVLNGCYSQAQAKAITEHVPYVIGMKQAIDDSAAIEFAVGFYGALGNRESVDFAFEAGKVAMELSSTGSVEMPSLLINQNVSNAKKIEDRDVPRQLSQDTKHQRSLSDKVDNLSETSERPKLGLKRKVYYLGLPLAIIGLAFSSVSIYKRLNPQNHEHHEPLKITLSNGRILGLDDLRQYLEKGDLQNANKETGALLLDIANLSGKPRFEKGDSSKIDCQGLEEIDKLWAEYSDGKFGINVQKNILLDVQTWARFIQKVEWEKNGQMLEDRFELTYDLSVVLS